MATDIEQRLVILEREVVRMGVALAAARAIAEKSLQNSELGSGLGFGGDGETTVDLAYCATAPTARVGNVCGHGTFQAVNGVITPGTTTNTLTATGDSNDSAITGYNITGGTPNSNAFGLLISKGGARYFVVLDCQSTTNPGTPATPAPLSSGTTTGTGASVARGLGVMAVSPTVTGTGSSFAGGSGVMVPPAPGYSAGGTGSGSGE